MTENREEIPKKIKNNMKKPLLLFWLPETPGVDIDKEEDFLLLSTLTDVDIIGDKRWELLLLWLLAISAEEVEEGSVCIMLSSPSSIEASSGKYKEKREKEKKWKNGKKKGKKKIKEKKERKNGRKKGKKKMEEKKMEKNKTRRTYKNILCIFIIMF